MRRVLAVQRLPTLDGQRLEEPVGRGRCGDLDAPRSAAGFHGLTTEVDELVPRFRGRFRVQAGAFEGRLVVVEHRRAALERDTDGLAIRLGIGPVGRLEIVRIESFCLLEVADGEDGIEVEHRLLVGRQHHGDIRRIPGLYRRLDLCRGVGIGAGERGFHDDVRVSGVELVDHLLHDLCEGTGDAHGIEVAQRDGILRTEECRTGVASGSRSCRHRQGSRCRARGRRFGEIPTGHPVSEALHDAHLSDGPFRFAEGGLIIQLPSICFGRSLKTLGKGVKSRRGLAFAMTTNRHRFGRVRAGHLGRPGG